MSALIGLALFLPVPVAAQCLQPPAGLVGHWPGNGSAADVAGGAPSDVFWGAGYGAGVASQGFLFNQEGLDDLVYVAPTAAQRVTTGMTIEGWIRFVPFEPQPGFYSLANATIAASGPVDGVSPLAWQLVVRVDPADAHRRQLVFAVRPAGGSAFAASASFDQLVPAFAHVAATYSATGVMQLYVNGQTTGPVTVAGGNVGTASGDNIFLGVLPFTTGYDQPFKGVIDEFSLYNRALPESDIDAIVSAGTAGKCLGGGGGGTTCYTVEGVTSCATSWVEGPPGFFVATGDIEIGPQGSPYFAVRDGQVKVSPANASMSYRGTLVVPTVVGDIPLYSTQGTSRWPVETNAAWYPDEFNGSFTRLLGGLPAFNQSGLDLANFPFASVPQFGIGVDLRIGCVSGSPSYSLAGLPETGDSLSADGWFNICAEDLLLHAGIDALDVSVAGCRLAIRDATIAQLDGNLGFQAGEFDLRLPLENDAFRANFRDVFVSATGVTIGGGELSLPPLSLGPFNLGYAQASIYPRTVGGYRVCGNAGFGFPSTQIGADISFALLGGELQRGCVSGTFPPTPLIPGIPVFVDRLGGCVTLPVSTTLYEGEQCNAESFYSDSGCLTGDCDLGLPEVALTTRLLAGIPGELGGGYLLTADPVTLAFGPGGFRASADVYALGNYFGTGEVCVDSWGAELCAAVDVGGLGFVTGDAHVYIDDEGISGSFAACVTFQQKCFLNHCWDEQSSFSAAVGLSNFDAGWRRRYGFWADVSACEGCFGGTGNCWPRATVAFDLRTGEFFWNGVTPLPRGSGRIAQGVLAEGDRAFGPFVVPAGASEIVFIADTDGAPLDVTVEGPSGILQEGDPGVRVEKKAAAGITLFGVTSPTAGSWMLTAHGAAPGMQVEGDAGSVVDAASVVATEPAADTDVPHVAWEATIPASAAAGTTLAILAAPTDELAATGAGRVIHEQALVAGGGSHDIAPWELESGTWSIVLRLDDGMGHISHVTAPGHLVINDTEAPGPPAFAQAFSLPGGARVTWLASPSRDVRSYEVEHQDPLNAADAVFVPAGDVLSLDIAGLAPDEYRRFFVRAVDASGNKSQPQEASIAGSDATADGTPPSPPVLELALIGPGALRATWTQPADAASYVVRYGITPDLVGGLADEGMSPMTTAATTLDLSGFEPGARIFVAVAALDANGNVSTPSNVENLLLTSGEDTDGDGLPDDWETLWMNSLALSGGGDADSDYLTDAAELALGLDPAFVSPFEWGDIAPAGSYDGAVNIADAVRAMRLSLDLETADEDVARRAEVAPAETLQGGRLRPTRAAPRKMTIADVVLILRVAVGLGTFDEPFPPGN